MPPDLVRYVHTSLQIKHTHTQFTQFTHEHIRRNVRDTHKDISLKCGADDKRSEGRSEQYTAAVKALGVGACASSTSRQDQGLGPQLLEHNHWAVFWS